MPPLAPGAIVDGKYRVVRTLGEGGMGIVFLVEHQLLRKQLAMKVLHAELERHPEASGRFQREARATSAIDHENVVRVTDFGCTAAGELYLVMELLEGATLRAELARWGRLTPTRALFIATEMLRGVEAAHALELVHRDLKPENVFIVRRPDGTDAIKLVDFGLAKLRNDVDQRLTISGSTMGTPSYMAPEQARGRADLDGRADLYAIGIVLYEMLAGRPPFLGDTYAELAHAILDGRPTPLLELAPDVDRVLNALVMKSIAVEPGSRFQSAREMREALQRHFPGAPLTSTAGLRPVHADELVSLPRGWAAPTLENIALADGPPSVMIEPASVRALAVGSRPAAPPPTPAPEAFGAPPEPIALELDRPPPTAVVVEPKPPRRAGGALGWAALALLLVAGLAGGGWWWWSQQDALPSAPVHLAVLDLPAGGHVFVDGRPTRARFEVPASTRPLKVRLEAPGYAARLLLVVPDADQTLDGRLDRSHRE